MVVWWSTLIIKDGIVKRIGMVCYWKSSIDLYMEKRQIHSNYLLFAKNKLKTLSTKSYSFINLNIMEKENVVGYEYLYIKK